MNKKSKLLEDNHVSRLPSSEKVDAILAGAMQEFLANGYAATTMDKVTAAAGVSKATVYSYFQDKEGLFAALIAQMAQRGCQAVFNPDDPQFLQGEPDVVLRRLATNMLEQIQSEQNYLNLVRLIIGESERFPVLAQVFVRNIDKAALQVLTQYFAKHPELQLPDPEVAARIFLGSLVHFNILQYMLHGEDILPMARDRLINNLVNLITIHYRANQLPTDGETPAFSTRRYANGDRHSGIRQKSSRRKRTDGGKFQTDYNEPKKLRSIRLTDTAWQKLAELAQQHNLTRSEMIEMLAREPSSQNEQ